MAELSLKAGWPVLKGQVGSLYTDGLVWIGRWKLGKRKNLTAAV